MILRALQRHRIRTRLFAEVEQFRPGPEIAKFVETLCNPAPARGQPNRRTDASRCGAKGGNSIEAEQLEHGRLVTAGEALCQ